MNLGHAKFEVERIGGYAKFLSWGMMIDLWLKSYHISYVVAILIGLPILLAMSWFDRKFVRGGELEKGLKDNPEWRRR
jgi:hypothetical protein